MEAFGFLFSAFGLLFSVMVMLVVGTILYRIVSGVSEWADNNNQPILSVPARVATKRHSTSVHHHHSDTHISDSASTTYYVTFELESGERREFRVRDKEFGMLADDDTGTLEYQGTRYLGFNRTL